VVIRVDGGIFVTNTGGTASYEPDKLINTIVGAYLSEGGDWTNASDRNLKENFARVSGREILLQLQSVDILRWNYKSQTPEITHIGPTAQDFRAAFGVGQDSTAISSIDPAGVALAAIKELDRTQQELASKVRQMEQMSLKLDELQEQVSELSQLVRVLLAAEKADSRITGELTSR